MIVIRRYFLFIILIFGSALAASKITLENKMKFYSSILHAHNFFRKIHDAAPLKFDEDMYHEAQRHVRSFTGESSTSETPNIYGVNSNVKEFKDEVELSDVLAVKIVGEWYYKSSGYNFFVEPTSNVADAFTQVVWKNTTSLGVDMAVIGNKLYVTVVYSPAGNKRNEYIANVGNLKDYNEIVFNHTDLQILSFLASL